MSIYHCSVKNVSRAKGASACAADAYIEAKRIYDERTGETFEYGRAERVIETETIIPEYAPAEYKDSSVLFNSIEQYEKSANARTAKKIEVALPVECDLEEQRVIVQDFIKENFTDRGYCATYAIHMDKDGINPHCHILVPNRQIDPETGTWAKTKTTKEYVLDKEGKRVPVIDPETGQQKLGKRNERLWQRRTVSQNPLDKKEVLKEIRHSWAVQCNRHLGETHQIDERSYAERGIEKIPTIHEGYVARQMEARGAVSDRMEQNRQIRERNKLLEQVKEQLKEFGEKIKELMKEKSEYVRDILQRSRLTRGDRETERGELISAGDRAITERADRETEQERLRAAERAAAARRSREREERSERESRGISIGGR